jgi:IclR family transcriptional regulator, acetate operon repressor
MAEVFQMAKNISKPAGEKRSRGRPRGSVTTTNEAGSVQSLDRAIALMKLVAIGAGLSLTEISQQSGLAASTAYRMLTTLQAHGMVEFNEADQLWFIGIETFRMGAAFLRRRKLAEQGRAIIQDLMLESGETANLAVADEDCVVFVSQVETHEAIRAFFRPGTRSPLHASGIGKAILAYTEPRQRDAMVKRLTLEVFTEKTHATRASLAADLLGIRARGFSVDDEERNLGMRCVAAAVFNEFGEPVGGVSISGPTVRMNDAKIAAMGPRVHDAARALTLAMGGSFPDAVRAA